MDIYHILLTTDENFAQHCGVCIVSLLTNNPNRVFHITVTGLDLSLSTKTKLTRCLDHFPDSILKFIDFPKEKLNYFPQIGQYHKNIYLRLWVDEFFDQNIEYVLYLDVDTLVVDVIDEIFHPQQKDFIIGAVDIPFADSHYRCHLPLEFGYFNSGVLLFNVKKWRKEHCREKLLEFLIKNKKIALNPDQDALNGVFFRQRLALDYTYNVITPFFRRYAYPKLGYEELGRIRKEAKIIHFNGLARPWLYSCNHPYQKKYFDYLNLTPWNKFIPSDKSLFTLLKKKLRIILRRESFIQLTYIKGL